MTLYVFYLVPVAITWLSVVLLATSIHVHLQSTLEYVPCIAVQYLLYQVQYDVLYLVVLSRTVTVPASICAMFCVLITLGLDTFQACLGPCWDNAGTTHSLIHVAERIRMRVSANMFNNHQVFVLDS